MTGRTTIAAAIGTAVAILITAPVSAEAPTADPHDPNAIVLMWCRDGGPNDVCSKNSIWHIELRTAFATAPEFAGVTLVNDGPT
jgi:hypothetical protein